MSDAENIIKQTTKKTENKVWYIISTIIKSVTILLMIGFIMMCLSAWGAEIYTKNSFNRSYTGGWNYLENLNSVYGLIGIIIYI